jgi:hypothetical protein
MEPEGLVLCSHGSDCEVYDHLCNLVQVHRLLITRFLLRLLFDLEGRGSIFLQNFCASTELYNVTVWKIMAVCQ